MKGTHAVVRHAAIILLCVVSTCIASGDPRAELSADFGWKFHLGDPSDAEKRSFSDESWRDVDLPHDWSIEYPPAAENPSGRGGGYFPAGVGWYRKSFDAPGAWQDKQVSVEFEGIYRGATVYLNGIELATQPFGYTTFQLDLRPHLDFNATNVLAVRVDNADQPNSRWYSGSGIYRHVNFIVTESVHVAQWGVVVTTPEVSTSTATVGVRTRVANQSIESTGITIKTTLLNEAGENVEATQSSETIAGGAESDITQQITVATPALWSPDTPRLYRAITQVLHANAVIDETATVFGIRSIDWSAQQGFLLNGESIKLAGANVHHDHGPLGAASFDRAEQRKAELLKAAGYNAVRTSHNPFSQAFLDACDRIGLLVFNDAFDTWAASKEEFDYGRNFRQWWVRDLTALVKRDRNHPSVIVWGIGNEIPELSVARGASMAQEMIAQVRSLDPTRPMSLSYPGATYGDTQNAVFSQLDIVGYNYNLARNHQADHERAPARIMMTTESFPAAAFEEWSLVEDESYIVGEFVWTAMDYLGESGIGAWSYGTSEQAATAEGMMSGMSTMVDGLMMAMANGMTMAEVIAQMMQSSPAEPGASIPSLFSGYPWHAAVCGEIDLIGHRKPHSYYREILWNEGDRVYAAVRQPAPEGQSIIAAGWAVYPTEASWTWAGHEGKALEIEVYSRAERVRLYLNDELIGEQPTSRNEEFKATFSVPYAPGELKAVGIRGDREVGEFVLHTADDPVRLRLTADRANVLADGQDLSFITVEAVDALGRVRLDADHQIEFSIAGPGVIAAVGNANGRDGDSYQGTSRKLFQGRAQVIVRTSRLDGAIQVTATSPGLDDGTVAVQSSKVSRPVL